MKNLLAKEQIVSPTTVTPEMELLALRSENKRLRFMLNGPTNAPTMAPATPNERLRIVQRALLSSALFGCEAHSPSELEAWAKEVAQIVLYDLARDRREPTLAALLELLEPYNWVFAKGRTRPSEPLYGIQIKDVATDDILTEAEHDDPNTCVALALTAMRK